MWELYWEERTEKKMAHNWDWEWVTMLDLKGIVLVQQLVLLVLKLVNRLSL